MGTKAGAEPKQRRERKGAQRRRHVTHDSREEVLFFLRAAITLSIVLQVWWTFR
jgi:hypothetical protein